jgi:acyl-coenzyme A thioesterase PaaI-like protein
VYGKRYIDGAARRVHARDQTTMDEKSLQETFAPRSACFGCGPANPKGLRIRSFARDGEVIADWRPEPHHEAFPGVLNGGIIGALLDCHCNWTAAHALMVERGDASPPSVVTAEYSIALKRPTPSQATIHLAATPLEVQGSRVTVDGTLEANGQLCATCRGVFVAVKPGHPAYHRW